MGLCWDPAQEFLDDIPVTNKGWYTRDSDCGSGKYAIRAANTYEKGNYIVAHKVAQL